jgi:hypothetical protein
MPSWSISISDPDYCDSVKALISKETGGFKPTKARGKKPEKSCKEFFQEVNRLINGEMEQDELLPVLVKEGSRVFPVKNLYELRVPGFRGYFRIDFRTGKGKGVFLLREPADPARVEMLIQKWQHLE